MKRWERTRPSGFTIIELLIVIIVIGILAVLTLVAYNGLTNQAVDKSVQSDADELDGLETDYALKNDTGGLAWYSGSGTNTTLNFTPSSGDVIDIVSNATDYCIRVYNPKSSTYNSLANAFTKESNDGACDSLAPSALAQAGAYSVNGGVVTTFAATTGTSGGGVAIDSSGNAYFVSFYNVYKVTPSGTITTLAGSGSCGSNNGTGTAASFCFPVGLAVDASGNIYVGDGGNNLIRMITPSGVVTTLAGSGASGSTNGTGTAASFSGIGGIAVDSSGNVYVADSFNNLIRMITPSGVVTTLAGSGASGSTNGTGTAASFNDPEYVAVDSGGNVYVTDAGNNLVRKITSSGVVTTLAGSGASGSTNGTGTAASFNDLRGITVDAGGYVFVAQQLSNLIRMISPTGVVTTLAGTGSTGSTNGTGTAASFKYPQGVAVDSSNIVYVMDAGNSLIREIQ